MLVPPLAVLFGLEDGLHLRVAGGSIHLFFCCALLCQRVSSLSCLSDDNDWFTVAAVCLKIMTGSLWLFMKITTGSLWLLFV